MDSLALDRAKRLAAVLSGRIFHRAIHGPLGGFFSSVLSACIVALVFFPLGREQTSQSAHLWSIAAFMFMGALISETFARLHRARAAAQGGFEAAFDQAAAGVALIKPDGRLFRVNRKYCEILGYDEKELLGKGARRLPITTMLSLPRTVESSCWPTRGSRRR